MKHPRDSNQAFTCDELALHICLVLGLIATVLVGANAYKNNHRHVSGMAKPAAMVSGTQAAGHTVLQRPSASGTGIR